MVRWIEEEPGWTGFVGGQGRVYSAHMPHARRDGRRADYHALRIVYDAWVPPDAPTPRVLEVDGSTIEAAWAPLDAVLDGSVPTAPMVRAGAGRLDCPFRMQRVGALRARSVATTRCCWCGSPPAAATPVRGACPAAGSTTARRRQPPWCARCARSAASQLPGRRPPGRARRTLQRHRALGPVRGLPRGGPGLRGHRGRRRRAPSGSRSTGRPTRSPGCRCAEITNGDRPVLDVVHEALAAAARRP